MKKLAKESDSESNEGVKIIEGNTPIIIEEITGEEEGTWWEEMKIEVRKRAASCTRGQSPTPTESKKNREMQGQPQAPISKKQKTEI